MADRGRDLKISILSDVERFDTAPAADELETLGQAAKDSGSDLDGLGRDMDRLGSNAKDAGHDLDRLGKDAKGTGDDLDRLAKDAKQTASKVDNAFEAIARSSKSNLKKVDASADHAGESVKEMSDEIKGEALEGAASFDGSMDSIKDSAQSAVAMALSAFGPLGAGIGVAASVAYGFFRAQTEKTKQAVTDLTDQMISDGGRLSRASVIAKIQEFAKDGSILDLTKQARDAKIPVADFIAAMAGDADAMARSTKAVRDRQAALADLTDASMDYSGSAEGGLAKALDTTSGKLSENEEQLAAAKAAVDALNESVPKGTEIQQAYSDSLDGFASPMSTYTDLLTAKQEAERTTAEKTAASTKDQKDSWEDYVKDAKVSIGDYNKALEEQVKAQEDWAKNLHILAHRGVDEGVLAELARLGPEGAPLVAGLSKSTNAELTKWEGLMHRKATNGASQFADGIDGGKGKAAAAAARTHAAVVNALDGPVTVQVGVSSRQAIADAEATHRQIQSYFTRNPLTVNVNPKPGQGQGYGVVRPRP